MSQTGFGVVTVLLANTEAPQEQYGMHGPLALVTQCCHKHFTCMAVCTFGLPLSVWTRSVG